MTTATAASISQSSRQLSPERCSTSSTASGPAEARAEEMVK